MGRKQKFWLSYDLGVSGDYEGLYRWLDQHEAEECGDSLAFLSFLYHDHEKKDFIGVLREEMEKAFEINNKTRCYIIWKDEKNQIRGSFLFGNRKRPPWTGFAVNQEKIEDCI